MKVEMAKQEATKKLSHKRIIVVNQASASKKKMEQHRKGAVIELE
jgi:predicted ribosome-associated RNA-binding protein Tma20